MNKHPNLILPLLIASSLSANGATLVQYTFTHAASSATPLTATTVGANMTATNVSQTGTLSNATADRLRMTDTPGTSFSSSTDFASFRIDADIGYYFDLTSATVPTVSFQIGRVSGSTPLIGQIQIWGSTSGTATVGSTLLYTSAEASATSQTMVAVANTSGIADINGTNQYTSLFAQVQWRTSGTPTSSALLFDNFTIAGSVVAIPEPTTWSALLGGVGMLALIRRRR